MAATPVARAVTVAAALALAGGALPSAAAAARQQPHGNGRYIVVLEPGADPHASADGARSRGAHVAHVYSASVTGYAATMSAAAAARLAHDPDVAWVQPDGVAHLSAQALPTGVDRAGADRSPTAGIDGTDRRVDVDVAVIDSGIDLDHPDLNVHTRGAKSCSTGRSADDANGHGTHVAGSIGALDNGVGVVGVAPGARLWPIRVVDAKGNVPWSAVICAVDHVTANADRIEVANMSLGGPGTDGGGCGSATRDAVHAAICRSVAAGVTYVVAAGNGAADASGTIPAAYDEVITVSALTDFDGAPGGLGSPTCGTEVDDTFAKFSNYGSDVDVVAPGVCIRSTSRAGGYATLNGTSTASPHVAGGAALYAAVNPGATPSQVRAALLAAGSSDWDAVDDGDSTKEPLLDVSGF